MVRLLGLVRPSSTMEEFNEAVTSLQNRIFTKQRPNTNIIEISLTSTDPEDAARLVNTIAEVYIANNMYTKKKQARVARQFIGEQLEIVRFKLKSAEETLMKYKEKEKITSSGSSFSISLSRMSDFESQLTKVKEDRKIKERKLDQLKTQLSRKDRTLELANLIDNNPDIVGFKNKLLDLEFQKSGLLREYTEKHPSVIKLNEEIQQIKIKLSQQIERIVGVEISTLEADVASLKAREIALSNLLEQYENQVGEIPSKEVMLSRLERDVSLNEENYKMFRQKFEEARISEAGKVGDVTILDPAIVPERPIKPNIMLNVIIGSIIGLILGIAFSFVIENLDTSIGTIEDVEKYMKLPVIGVIPHITSDDDRKKFSFFQQKPKVLPKVALAHRLVTHYDPKSPVAEAYRTLRTNIQFKGLKKGGIKTLLFTSSGPQEGKTTTLSNFSITQAQVGSRVLLVGCNLRRPTLYSIFGVDQEPGLTNVLAEEAIKFTSIPNLHLLPSGPLPPNPSELLGSEEMTKVIAKVRDMYDLVIFDSPPILPVTDAAVLASKVDGVVLVYFVGRAAREALMRAKIQLEHVNANVLGIVLNDIKAEGELGPSYYYHYKYYGNRRTKKINS